MYFHTEEGDQGLSSFEELSGRDSIVVASVHGDIGEGLLNSVEPGRHFGLFCDWNLKLRKRKKADR